MTQSDSTVVMFLRFQLDIVVAPSLAYNVKSPVYVS